MSQDYYYFISGLPNLAFEDTKLSCDLEKFSIDAKAQLSVSDYACLEILHLTSELDTLLSILYKTEKDFNPECLHTQKYWEEYLVYLKDKTENHGLATPEQFAHIPSFIAPIISIVLTQEEIQPFSKTEHELLIAFYDWTANFNNEFIKKWFAYDAHIRSILSAINGRKFNLPYTQYLIGESEMVESLAKSHAADFGLGKADELFDSIVRVYEQNNILYRERGYDILRWKWIDNQNFFNYFTIDRILGYYSKLRILNRWLKADPHLGKEIFHDTLNAMENSFTFPEEFNIKSIRK
ncbi:MAG: DUF2764 family protein [Candidatus Cloacimonetes bacterium]|nr:DUF2764 family protein [Candidatus Cloacimonadota bacterium]